MNNKEIYNNAFMEAFGVEEETLNEEFTSEKVSSWDSMRKLNLLNILEDEFNVMFNTNEMLEFSSYEKGKEILAKHNIVIE